MKGYEMINNNSEFWNKIAEQYLLLPGSTGTDGPDRISQVLTQNKGSKEWEVVNNTPNPNEYVLMALTDRYVMKKKTAV